MSHTPAAAVPESSPVDVNGPTPLSTVGRWWVIALCSLVCLLDGYDVLVAPVSVPVLALDWGLAPSAFTAALTATVLGMALGAVFIAPLGDRYGRRVLITGSFAAVGAASLLTPLSSTVLELTLFRFVTGLGMGASIANALALASEIAAPRWRSRVTILVYSMSAIGSIFGGLIAPGVLAAAGWQGLYVVGGVIPLLLAPLLYLSIPRPAPARTPVEAGGPGAFASVLITLKMLLATPYRGRTVLLWALYFLSLFSMYVISSWLPTLMNLYGWSLALSVRAIMVFSMGGVTGGLLIGWMVDRGYTSAALLMGFGASAAAMVTLAVAPASIWLWMALIAVIGGGIIGVSYAVAALAAVVYPAPLRAAGIGAASAMGRLGATLAPVVGGWLIALGASVVQIFAGLVVPMVVGLVIVYLFARLFQVRAPQ